MKWIIRTGFAGQEIEELKTENNKLLDVINNQDASLALSLSERLEETDDD